MTRGGPFATNGAAANVFLKTRDGLERPDVQLIAMTVGNSAELWMPGMTAPPVYCFTVRLGALHPQSRGWVKLRSADPADNPRIRFNMFQVPEDLRTMVRGLRVCREIYGSPPISERIDREIAPGAHLTTDADLEAFIRANAGHRDRKSTRL